MEKKRLIETILPLQEIGYESSREKYQRKGQISSLHNWWSRKPLISARLSILASLLNAPDSSEEKLKLFDLIKKICSRNLEKNSSAIKLARESIYLQRKTRNLKCLDSFAGGGSIPLEALRLGCESYSLDLNPVAYIIQLCTIKYPQEYGKETSHSENETFVSLFNSNPLERDVKKYGDLLGKRLNERLGKFYKGNVNEIISHYLWARTIKCPNPSCERLIPLMKNFWLVKKKKIALKLIDEKNTFKFKITKQINFNPDEGTISLGNVRCPFCKQSADVSYVRKESQEKRIGSYLSAVCFVDKNTKEKKFREPQLIDFNTLKKAEEEYNRMKLNHDDLLSFIPNEPAPRKGTGPQRFFSYSNYGFETFDTLFTKRQALTLGTIIYEIHSIYDLLIDKNYDPDYARAIITYFALILDRMADLNCNLTSWRASDGGVRNLFDRPTISMKWGYGETNPIGKRTGSWSNLLTVMCNVIRNLSKVSDKGAFVFLGSATDLPFEANTFDIVSVDPPYFDYIIYSDVSDFFYVWLKRSIGIYYPDVFATPLTPKSMEIIHNRHRHNDDEEASRQFYEDNLRKSFEEIKRVLKEDGLATIMFTHRSTEAWESLLTSIVNAGLTVTASWPLRTEMQSRLQSVGRKGQSTVGSTIFLVCKKRVEKASVGFLQEIKGKFSKKIDLKLKEFWNNGIMGSDFFISAIGPGMEEFSKYRRIEDYSGNQVTVRNLLDEIRLVTTDYIIKELLKDSPSTSIDHVSQFYLTFRWAYLDNEVDYDEVRLLSNCFGVSLDKLERRDGLVKKSTSKVSVLDSIKRKKINRTETFVDTMHYLLSLWKDEKRDKIENFLEESDITSKEDFWQFFQAVSETLLVGNREKQLIEGFLLSKDKYIRKLRALEKTREVKDLGDFI